ncbi:MAG: porin [Ottowia sp.]|nr:porin [Ottowia sp.]
MKKSLIALAVLATAGLGFSGVAAAQSSVTLYGVADAGIGKAKSAGDDRVHMLSSSMMNNGTSRLGVRGVEDLGSGLKVGFNFEQGLSLNDGRGNLSGGNTWSRAANVWIGGDWGTFKMGRTLNPSFFGVAAWELTGTANYSVVGNTYNFADSGARNSSQFSYKTPNFNGLSAELGYIFKSDNVIGGVEREKWDANVVYANGPIAAGLSVNKTKDFKTHYSLGGKYNFGQFAVAASYSDTGETNLRRRGFSLGGSFNTGPFTATLDLTRDTKNDVGPKKYTNGLLEGKYALSKRTFVYAAYLRFDGENNYGIGMRHNF